MNTEKTRTVSFKLSGDVAEALATEAEVRKVNPSTLVSQIVRHHMGFEGNMGKAGLVAFPRPLLMRLMDGYSEEKVIAMAEHISQDIMTDMMAVLQNEYTVESFLHVVQSWAKASKIPFRHEIKGNLNTCILQHDLNRNWSLYLAHLYKNVIEELTQKKVAINVTSNIVRFIF